MLNASRPPFQEFFDHHAHFGVVDGAESIVDDSAADAVCAVLGNECDDLVRVTENRDVGVVAGEDELPPSFGVAEAWYDVFVDEAVVKIVLRLVDDQGRVTAVQEKEQQSRRLLPGREVIEAAPDRRCLRSDVQVLMGSSTSSASIKVSAEAFASVSACALVMVG